jgi:pyridoxine kinase
MGDHGKLYSRLDEDHVFAMSEICKEADILLPNLTEAAFLTEIPYREETDGAYLRALTGGLFRYYGVQSTIITGISGANDTIGFCGADREEGIFVHQGPRIPRSCHGTGDIFAAAFAGALSRGKTAERAADIAARFTLSCMELTLRENTRPYGVMFEPVLPELMAAL